MLDAVINHASRQSAWFRHYLNGDQPYDSFFITCDPAADYTAVVRPRALPLLTRVQTTQGLRMVWTTFSDDQIDLNFRSPELLLEILNILLDYAHRGARFIRLDAIGFAWKEPGTSCMNLPQTHALVRLFHAFLARYAPGTLLITETNVPSEENLAYLGNGHDEADLVYQFPLPPLTLHAFLAQDATYLTRWAEALPIPEGNATFFNFLASHDGIGLRPVEGILPEHATKFIAPLTFEQLTGNRCMVDTFDRNFSHQVEHIALARRADLVMVAPATANVCAKLAHGLADDMLTTTVLACSCPKLIAPAMNTGMYENPVTQDNLDLLRKYGWEVIAPASGRLACGDVGAGKLPEPDLLLQHILRVLALPHDLEGKRVLVTAGPTQEALDPVRYLTNHSTGKMGYAIARMAMLRGAQVTLVSGPTALEPPPFVEVVPVVSAQDMFEAVTSRQEPFDLIFKAAAVADYTPADYSDDKVKKKEGDLSIPLKRTQDILQYLGDHRRPGQVICGFSMETRDLLQNSTAKLEKKRVDMICANNLKVAGAGFGTDTNVITLITRNGAEELPLLSKEEAANRILDRAVALL